MSTQQIAMTGLAWYSREGYPAARARMKDGSRLPITYEDWLKKAEDLEKQVSSTGAPTIRVYVDGDNFTRFCRDSGLDLDTAARRQFCSEAARRAVGTN